MSWSRKTEDDSSGRYTTVGRVLIARFNKCEQRFSSYIANLINAFGAYGQATPLNLSIRVWLERHVGWAINRIQQYTIATSKEGKSMQVTQLSRLSWRVLCVAIIFTSEYGLPYR